MECLPFFGRRLFGRRLLFRRPLGSRLRGRRLLRRPLGSRLFGRRLLSRHLTGSGRLGTQIYKFLLSPGCPGRERPFDSKKKSAVEGGLIVVNRPSTTSPVSPAFHIETIYLIAVNRFFSIVSQCCQKKYNITNGSQLIDFPE